MRKSRAYFKQTIIFPTVVLSIIFGTFAGTFTANFMDNSAFFELAEYMNRFFDGLGVNDTVGQKTLLLQAVLRYGKYVLLIWTSGFFVMGIAFNLLTMGLNGFVYGFTTAFLFRQYGLRGIRLVALGYLPQNIVVIPALIFLSVMSLRYALRNSRIIEPVPYGKNYAAEYVVTLLIGLACVLLAGLLETYFSAAFIQGFSTLL